MILGSRILVENTTRNSSNIYILDEVKEKCCMGKLDEIWLWNRRMDHINFENLEELKKSQVVTYMPNISKPNAIICKPC